MRLLSKFQLLILATAAASAGVYYGVIGDADYTKYQNTVTGLLCIIIALLTLILAMIETKMGG